MTERVWDRYLTDQDKAYVAANPAPRKGVGKRPALRRVIGNLVDGDEGRIQALAEFGQ